jgi:hypothetical protein
MVEEIQQKCWSAISTSAALSLSRYLVSFALTTAAGRAQRNPNLAALKDRFKASWVFALFALYAGIWSIPFSGSRAPERKAIDR